MSQLICLLFLSFLVQVQGCGKRNKEDEAKQVVVPEDIQAKIKLYKELSVTTLDKYGFVHGKCDSVGFTSLCLASGGCSSTNVFAAEVNGRWYRHAEHDCLALKETKSDMSRDHILMLLTLFQKTGQVEPIKRMRGYLEGHNWQLGDHDGSVDGLNRVQALGFAPLIIDMSKGEFPSAKPQGNNGDVVYEKKGFEAHLEVLTIRLEAAVYGAITGSQKDELRKQAERVPRNALFVCMDKRFSGGDVSKGWEILRDESLYPKDRLPTSKERCTDYLNQRDDGDDWKPCDENKVHAGVDFLFAAEVCANG